MYSYAELFLVKPTDAERHKVLSLVRTGTFPSDVFDAYRDDVAVISDMVKEEPSDRLESWEILMRNIGCKPLLFAVGGQDSADAVAAEMTRLIETVSEQQATIAALQEQIRRLTVVPSRDSASESQLELHAVLEAG